jgi:hypothetical protein
MKKRKKKLRRNWYVSCNTRSSSSRNCSPEPFLQWVVLEILFSSFAKLAKRNANQKTYLGFYLFFLSSLEQWKNPHLRFSTASAPRRLNSQVRHRFLSSLRNLRKKLEHKASEDFGHQEPFWRAMTI